MITQKRLKELVSYCPATGLFTRVRDKGRARNGSVAGSLSNGYIEIRIDKKIYKAHRLAWLYVHGFMPKSGLDHINRVRDDNRISNLRMANQSLNMKNVDIRSNNTSGFTGVVWDKKNSKWQAQIHHHGKLKKLGRFKDKNDAISIRKEWEERLGYVS